MAQPRDLGELRALVRRLEVGMEGLSTEALQAARFPEARVSAMRDALGLADELTGLRRALDNHVGAAVRWWQQNGCCLLVHTRIQRQGCNPEAQCDAMRGLLTGVMTRLTALQDGRMDTVAHLALHEVPFDTRLYRQAARAVSSATARYLDAVLLVVRVSCVCERRCTCSRQVAAQQDNPSAQQLDALVDGLRTVHRCFAFAEGWGEEGVADNGLQQRYRALQQAVVQRTRVAVGRAVAAGV